MSKKVPKDFSASLDLCDQWIREGQANLARKEILRWDLKSIPRPLASRFGAIARRTQLWNVSLRVLRPIVRPPVASMNDAFPDEKSEYALSLWRVGAFGEAQSILADPKLQQEPRVWLAQAHGHIHRWDYELALPLLRAYVGAPNISEYERRIGEVNLLACLRNLGDESFEETFAILNQSLQNSQNVLLQANSMEMRAQFLIGKGDYTQAEKVLLQARELITQESGRSTFLIEKWLAIQKALASQSSDVFETIRKKALAISNWEALRDIDYYQTVFDPQCRWSQFAYFGTPFRRFRKKLKQLRTFNDSAWLSLEDGASVKVDPWFIGEDDGDLCHRFMTLMLRDLYRPVLAGEIFSLIHPDQFFDQDIAANRIRKLVGRTKKYLLSHNLPFRLEERDGAYSLRFKSEGCVLLRKELLPLDKVSFFFARHSSRYGQSIPSAEWATEIGKSEEQTRRLLALGVRDGQIIKSGQGQFTTYALTPNSQAESLD